MDINKICGVINKGELAITPTDTVYGILGDATNIDTINKVYEAKQRSPKKSLIVLVSSIDMLKEYVESINELEMELINRFWPGKITLILKKNDKISDVLTGGLDTIAVRIPDNEELLEVIKRVNKPLISTSANISDNQTITNVSMIEDDLRKYISYVYDGGDVFAMSSTIVKVDDGKIYILRDGDLSNIIKNEFSHYIG